jgi:hypothetical protein
LANFHPVLLGFPKAFADFWPKFAAKHRIGLAKVRIRGIMRELMARNSGLRRIPEIAFDDDGIDFRNILCCVCNDATKQVKARFFLFFSFLVDFSEIFGEIFFPASVGPALSKLKIQNSQF